MIKYFNLLINNIYDDVFYDDDVHVNILNNLRQLDYHIDNLNNHFQKTLIHDDCDDVNDGDDDDYECGDFYVIHMNHNLFHLVVFNDDDDVNDEILEINCFISIFNFQLNSPYC